MMQIFFKTALGVAAVVLYLFLAMSSLRAATEAGAKPALKVFPGETIHIKTNVRAYASLN